MVNVTKKECVRKHFCCSLLWLPDQRVPLWSGQLHIVMEPLAATSGSVGNQNWYFVRDTECGLLVCDGVVGGAV